MARMRDKLIHGYFVTTQPEFRSPGGAEESSPRREPWVVARACLSPGGAKETKPVKRSARFLRPSGANG